MKIRNPVFLFLFLFICIPYAYPQHSSKGRIALSGKVQHHQDFDSLKIQKAIGNYIKGYYYVSDDFYGACFNHRGYHDKMIRNSIEGLLQKDVILYYNLQEKYDSPLKRKIFMQTQDYQKLSEHLEKEYNYLLEDTFYISSKIEKTNYDINKKSFFFVVPTGSILYSTTKYVCFDNLGIVTPLLNNSMLQVNIDDEQIALAVENNYQDCRLVYAFTINETLSKKDPMKVIGNMKKLFLINAKNEKCYFYSDLITKFERDKNALTQYDHNIYVRYKKVQGYDYPIYFLKTTSGYIQLADEDEIGYEDYFLEEKDGAYFVKGTNGKKYKLTFKPAGILLAEKDEKYASKCDEIRKDYLVHPHDYEDVTKTDADGVVHFYIDKNGYEWILESENRGFHMLENESVYILFEDQKFIRRKN